MESNHNDLFTGNNNFGWAKRVMNAFKQSNRMKTQRKSLAQKSKSHRNNLFLWLFDWSSIG